MSMFTRLAAVAAVLATVTPAHADTVLKFGIAGYYEGHLPLVIAEREGYFREAGFTSDLVNFRGGAPAVQALVGGSIDFCVCAADHVVRLNNRGQDIRVLVGLDEHHASALVALKQNGFTDVKSLQGKIIGVTAPGSYSDNTVRWEIKRIGLDPERDFRILGVGTGVAMRAALETGQIQAGTLTTTDIIDANRETGKFVPVADWRRINYAALVVFGRQRWVDANPKLARGLVQAVGRAQQVIRKDAKVTEAAIRAMFPTYDEANVQAFAASARQRLSVDGSVSDSGWNTMLEVLALSDPGIKLLPRADLDLQPALAK